jgi:hypothetical protein
MEPVEDEAGSDRLSLAEALMQHVGQRRGLVLQWLIGNLRAAANGGIVPEDGRDQWVEANIELERMALTLLRSGEWVAEGFRPGALQPEFPPASWWQRPVRLDLPTETVEWNGVVLNGLMVSRPGITALCSRQKRISRRAVSARQLDSWMKGYAGDSLDNNGEKCTREEAVRACINYFDWLGRNATTRAAGAAYARLPEGLKRRQGEWRDTKPGSAV